MQIIKNVTENFSMTDFLLIGAGILIFIVFLVLKAVMSRKDVKDRVQKKELEDKRYLNMYRIFTEHPLFSKIFRNYVLRLSKRLSILSVYTKREIQIGAAKYAYQLFCGIIVCAVISLLVFEDAVSVILCIVFFYVYIQTSIERTVEATTFKVYQELKAAIVSIRIEYKKGNSDVLLAIENASYGNRIAPVMERLHSVLTSAAPEEALTEFYEMIPFKQIQTLAMICFNINNSGDSLDKYNNSTFDEAMLLMNSDINQKIEQMHYEQIKFKKLENLALLGILLTVAIRYLMTYLMPAVALLYNSFVGFLIQNGVIFMSIYYYYMIAHAHLQSVMSTDDRLDMVQSLMEIKFIRNFIRTTAPEGQKRRVLKRKLGLCFSKKTVEDFWCEKCLYALSAFIAVAILVFSSPGIEKKFLINYTKSFDMMADNSAYEDEDGNPVITKEKLLEMDNTYIGMRNMGKWVDNKDEDTLTQIQEFIRSYLPNISTLQMQDQVTRLETKYEKLSKVGFRWYLLFTAYAAAAYAFTRPDKALKRRQEIAKEEEEEEFLQLQIVTMILASMDLDAMEAVGHLALIADIHKNLLVRCDYGFASNPIAELDFVQTKTQSENFKQFVGKLKETVEELSLKEAFADLASDREHICSERDSYIKESINRRRAKMGILSLRPMNFAIYGMMVFPLLYTGLTGLISSVAQINAL